MTSLSNNNLLQYSKYFLIFTFCLFVKCSFGAQAANEPKIVNSVEHKNLQLDLYLDLIRYNSQEKIGILPYILQNPEGVYLEIGTGGDPIAEMLDKIPADSQVTLVASDIDENILKALPYRHPELKKYIDATKGAKLKLQKLNAVDMSIFKDNFLSGINASSILHEIISYAGGFDGMGKFFKEAFRTLKPGGVLVYRDPENVADKESIVSVKLKNKSIRLFAHIFLYKFLDRRGSTLAKNGTKFELYKPGDVNFKIYKKNELSAVNLTYDQYLEVPSYDIDFSRRYMITLPKGLYRELARHYITYLHQCNPLMFVKCIPDIASGKYTINYLAHSTSSVFNNFLGKNNWQVQKGKINTLQKNELDQEIDKNTQVLEFGVPLHFASKVRESELRSLLKKYDLNPSNYIIALNNGDCLLDYRIFGMLYDEINQQVFDKFNGVVDKKMEEHAKWLKREGEEFYFYCSDDELITKVLETTLAESDNTKDSQEIYVLCPLSETHNKFINRLCYTEILNSSLEVHDKLGYAVEVKDGKRIIHFCKKSLKEAISICKSIIEASPLEYQNLQNLIDKIEIKVKGCNG